MDRDIEMTGDGRAAARAVRESYTMLLESDAFARNTNRALRCDLCVSRVIILVLLVTHTAFCVLLYIQPALGDKNNETPKENLPGPEKYTGYNSNEIPDAIDSPLVALIGVAPDSSSGTLKMQTIHNLLKDFELDASKQNLVIPTEGKYRLGLQITYNCGKMDSGKGYIYLNQGIFSKSPSYENNENLVLSAVDTISCRSDSICYKSIYSEIIAVLQKGDIIRVSTNNPTRIDYGGTPGTKNFLTVQLISKI